MLYVEFAHLPQHVQRLVQALQMQEDLLGERGTLSQPVKIRRRGLAPDRKLVSSRRGRRQQAASFARHQVSQETTIQRKTHTRAQIQ